MIPDTIPVPCVVTLIGAAGSGKTAIASAFPRSWRLSLDACRQRVADDFGDQQATADAIAVFDAALAGRLARRLPTVVDATNTEAAVRATLIDRAHRHGLPAVAIVARTDLATCLARQTTRSADRAVPADAVARQHDGIPTHEQLHAEGYDQVHDAADLDWMRLLLERSTAAGLDVLADIRAAFGSELTAVFTFDPDSTDSRGTFAIAGRGLTVRWADDYEPFDQHWQARVDSETCEDCDGTVWAKVTDAADLLAVYNGQPPEELFCDVCNAPDYYAA